MNTITKRSMILVMGGVMAMLLVQPNSAEASHRWRTVGRHKHGHRHYEEHNPHVYGRFTFSIPKGFIKVSTGGRNYHYRDGHYFHKRRGVYHSVHAPVGACVPHLPHGYQKFAIDGHDYYAYNKVYYEHTPQGYVVIEKPHAKHAKKSRHHRRNKNTHSNEGISLKIQNKDGEYIAITINPSGNGFVGPQGEYYDHFPRIEHLKIIYGS